jgi:hypothetical protein
VCLCVWNFDHLPKKTSETSDFEPECHKSFWLVWDHFLSFWLCKSLVFLPVRRDVAIDFQIDLDHRVIKWEMIEFCDRNFDQFLQSISIISHLITQWSRTIWKSIATSLPVRYDLLDLIVPMAITCSFPSSLIRALSHSPWISPKLEKDVFIAWRKLCIISALPTRRSYRAGAQVRREFALKQVLPLGYVNAWSIRNKIPRLQRHIASLDLDVLEGHGRRVQRMTTTCWDEPVHLAIYLSTRRDALEGEEV